MDAHYDINIEELPNTFQIEHDAFRRIQASFLYRENNRTTSNNARKHEQVLNGSITVSLHSCGSLQNNRNNYRNNYKQPLTKSRAKRHLYGIP